MGIGTPQLAFPGPLNPEFLHLPRTAVSGSNLILISFGFSYFALLFFPIILSPYRLKNHIEKN